MNENKISFVIPCYRSENTIEFVIGEIIETMKKRNGWDYEIVLVNDCSPDNVYIKLKKMAQENKKIKVINFTRNFGKASAVLAACARVTGDYVVLLDDDGQCPTKNTWNLIDALDDADIAVADYPQKKETKWKRFGSKVNEKVMNFLIEQPENIHMNNFLAFRKLIADEIVKYKNPFPSLHPLLVQATHSIKMVPMEERERVDGAETGFTFLKSLRLMVSGCTNFSVKPLRLALALGVLVALLGFVFLITIVVRKLIDPCVVVGYSSIMAVLLFIGGIIMVLLGIIGEYLGRIFVCINSAPQYVIEETINV